MAGHTDTWHDWLLQKFLLGHVIKFSPWMHLPNPPPLGGICLLLSRTEEGRLQYTFIYYLLLLLTIVDS